MKRQIFRGRSLETQEIALLKRMGRVIGEYAAKRKISVERLAYEAGVSKGYLYDIVKGKGNPSLIILHRIASTLNLPLTDFTKFL